MSAFAGSGILLNPFNMRYPTGLYYIFGSALASPPTNMCALRDELGAIAYSMVDNGVIREGKRLFRTLESGCSLMREQENISRCLQKVTSPVVFSALLRSGRYFQETKDVLLAVANFLGIKGKGWEAITRTAAKKIQEKRNTDEEIATALEIVSTQAEAAEVLDVSQPAISLRIAEAPDHSPLAIFRHKRTRVPDKEIAHALETFVTLRGAARELGLSPGYLSDMINNAPEDSPLAKFKYERSHFPEEEIADAMEKHGTQKAAARQLGISQTYISQRIAKDPMDSPLAKFKGRKS